MRRNDREALKLAIELTKAEPERREQVEWKLAHDGWDDTARFCAYYRQSKALQLRPWQQPPCRVPLHSTSEWDVEAVALLRRMLAAGVSRYHPDPLRALDEAGRAG